MDIEKERAHMCENCKTLYKDKKDAEECLKWCKDNSNLNPLLESKKYDDCELGCSKKNNHKKVEKTTDCECLTDEDKKN